jgi:hypothetical protein
MIEPELDQLEKKAKRTLRARRRRGSIWSHLAWGGTLGLVLVLPPVAGAGLGHWLFRRGETSAAPLIGLFTGLAIGITLTVLQIRRSLVRERDDDDDDAGGSPPGDRPEGHP